MPLDELISDLELAGIRADAEQLFRDACVIERLPTSSLDTIREVDQGTGELVDSPRDLIYTGKCSIWPIKSRRDRFDEYGQGLIFTRQYRVTLPYDDTTQVQIRDRVTVTSSDDAQVIGREMEVRDVLVSTIVGYRSLTVHDSAE